MLEKDMSFSNDKIQGFITEQFHFDPKNEINVSDINFSDLDLTELGNLISENFDFDPEKSGSQIKIDCNDIRVSYTVLDPDKEIEFSIESKLNPGPSLNVRVENSFYEEKTSSDSANINSLYFSCAQFIPKSFREHYLGELMEKRSVLGKKGLPRWWISIITLWDFLVFFKVSHWERIRDLIVSLFKYFRQFIK